MKISVAAKLPQYEQKPKDHSEELLTDDHNNALMKFMSISCMFCLILYVTSIALLLGVIVRGVTEDKETISELLMMKLYAVMLLIASLFVPCNDKVREKNVCCVKYSKLAFIFVSLLTHFSSLALFPVLVSNGQKEIVAAIALQIMGFIIEGIYFRCAIAAVFEPSCNMHPNIQYDASPMFGIV